jgi:hypothetical protein
MIKLKKTENDREPSFSERLRSSTFFLDLYEKKNLILTFIVAFILFASGLFWWFHSSEKEEIQGYFNALTLTKKLSQGPDLFEDQKQKAKTKDEIFNELENQYRLNKKSQDKLKGIMAEEYLLHSKNKEALLLFPALIEQLKMAGLSAFSDFDQIGYFITQSKFNQAYEATKALEQNKEKAKLPFFSGMVLLYKAALENKLGKAEECKKTIIDLQNLSKGGYAGFSEEDMQMFAIHLQEGDRNLSNYLKK